MGNNQSKPMVGEKTYMFQSDGPMVDLTAAANLVGDETFKTKELRFKFQAIDKWTCLPFPFHTMKDSMPLQSGLVSTL